MFSVGEKIGAKRGDGKTVFNDLQNHCLSATAYMVDILFTYDHGSGGAGNSTHKQHSLRLKAQADGLRRSLVSDRPEEDVKITKVTILD